MAQSAKTVNFKTYSPYQFLPIPTPTPWSLAASCQFSIAENCNRVMCTETKGGLPRAAIFVWWVVAHSPMEVDSKVLWASSLYWGITWWAIDDNIIKQIQICLTLCASYYAFGASHRLTHWSLLRDQECQDRSLYRFHCIFIIKKPWSIEEHTLFL